jgi:hypothetical protein
MFNLFKKKNLDLQKIEKLLLNTLEILPDDFDYIKNQIKEGLIRGFKKEKFSVDNFYKVSFNASIIQKFENKKGSFLYISGIEVFDLSIQEYTKLYIYICYDILMGYATPNSNNFDPDLQRIRIDKFDVKPMKNSSYDKLKAILSDHELSLINSNDVYELELNSKIYYHLADMEDGDFLAIDDHAKVYKITHDPMEFLELHRPLIDILKI